MKRTTAKRKKRQAPKARKTALPAWAEFVRNGARKEQIVCTRCDAEGIAFMKHKETCGAVQESESE